MGRIVSREGGAVQQQNVVYTRVQPLFDEPRAYERRVICPSCCPDRMEEPPPGPMLLPVVT